MGRNSITKSLLDNEEMVDTRGGGAEDAQRQTVASLLPSPKRAKLRECEVLDDGILIQKATGLQNRMQMYVPEPQTRSVVENPGDFSRRRRRQAALIAIFSYVGILLTLANIVGTDEYGISQGAYAVHIPDKSTLARFLLINEYLMAGFTAMACVTILAYYRTIWKEKCLEWDLAGAREGMSCINTTLPWLAIGEIIIHLLCPWPSMTPNTFAYTMLELATMLRLYTAIRPMNEWSMVTRYSGIIKSSQTNRTKIGWRTSIKVQFYQHTEAFLVVLTLVICVLGGFACFLAEHQDQPADFRTFASGMWFSWVTFTTVGFGDLSPKTLLGRGITVVVSLGGLIITALAGGVITNKLALTSHQKSIVSTIRQTVLQRELRKTAAQVIQASWKVYTHGRPSLTRHLSLRTITRGRVSSSPITIERLNYKRYRLAKRLRTLQTEMQVAVAEGADTSAMISVLFEEIRKQQRAVAAAQAQLNASEERNKRMEQKLDLLMDKLGVPNELPPGLDSSGPSGAKEPV